MRLMLEVNNVSSAYGQMIAVREVTFNLEKGEIGCLLGPSGSGKTTLLRNLAGFQRLLRGEIYMDGRLVSTEGLSVPPEKRKVGMLFQDYALFPHLTVQANVEFGLKGVKKHARKRRVADLLNTVGLEDFKNKYPHELSGGEQQRVALARSLATKPRLLLLDEPFSNLDVTLRERLCMEVRNIIKEQGTTALMVTHSQHEAFAMADKIGIISGGRMLQWDTTYNIYHNPADPGVAAFVGEGVLLQGKVLDQNRVVCGLGVLEGVFSTPCPAEATVDVLIRPEDIIFREESPLRAEILSKTFRGSNILYTLRLSSGDSIVALMPNNYSHEIGQKIGICPQVKNIIIFNSRKGKSHPAHQPSTVKKLAWCS